jgi:hypothetical protein
MAQKRSNRHLQNRLLAALPPTDFSLFDSDLKLEAPLRLISKGRPFAGFLRRECRGSRKRPFL